MKKIILLGLILVILFCMQILNTFSLFESKTDLSVVSNSAKWIIKLNDTDIIKNKEFSINSLNIINNDSVLNGKFAPGVSGYFDVIVVPTGTEVSIIYNVTMDLSSINNDSIVLSSVNELSGRELIKTGENTYTGIIPLEDINNGVTCNIRFTFEWLDDDTIVDYSEDLNNQKLNIPVIFNFKQYLGEEITVYNG